MSIPPPRSEPLRLENHEVQERTGGDRAKAKRGYAMNDDFPYRAAATLAIDLIERRPNTDEGVAADIAWRAYKDDEKPGPQPQFRAARYREDVLRAIRDIRSGRRGRVDPSPTMWEKALEQLQQSPG
jgi:hypothetical protein